MKQKLVCERCKKEKSSNELVKGLCSICADWRKRVRIEIRVTKEREAKHLCKWCGNELKGQQDWENTCHKCGGDKSYGDRIKIFNYSIEKKRKENPHWFENLLND